MSTMLDPRVIDASSLIPRAAASIYLPVGIEGEADSQGSGNVGTLYTISRVDEAQQTFGPNASLTAIIQAVLDRGAGPVIAVASTKGTAPALADRQAVWQALESDENIRLRLTDSVVQADLVGLGISAKNANAINNKQVAITGLASGTSKSNLIAAAAALAADVDAATRTVLVGPGVYDQDGVLQSGAYAAACASAEIAKNADPANDLDLWTIPLLTGVEQDANGLPVFRRMVVGGVAVDDYEDLLQGGVSPLQPSRTPGGVMSTHFRTVYTVNGTYDALYTRIIVDQVFLDVKGYILDGNFLRLGNTDTVRARIKSGIEALLAERASWISPVTQPDGTQGYNVTVTPSADQRQITIGYEGTVVRGISTVQVAANLTIPV